MNSGWRTRTEEEEEEEEVEEEEEFVLPGRTKWMKNTSWPRDVKVQVCMKSGERRVCVRVCVCESVRTVCVGVMYEQRQRHIPCLQSEACLTLCILVCVCLCVCLVRI